MFYFNKYFTVFFILFLPNNSLVKNQSLILLIQYMKKSASALIVNTVFGLLFILIGFINTFWGNDPFYGLFIILLSIVFFLPIINFIIEKIPQKTLFILKIVLGLFIIWSSLGVGELFDKIEIMKSSFPVPSYESIEKK